MEKCPHSSALGADPRKCSLCISEALGIRPRKITQNPDTRQLMIDGVPIERKIDGSADRITPPNAGKPRGSGRLARTCSLCGSVEHNRNHCDGSGKKANGTDAMMRADKDG